MASPRRAGAVEDLVNEKIWSMRRWKRKCSTIDQPKSGSHRQFEKSMATSCGAHHDVRFGELCGGTHAARPVTLASSR